MKRHVINLLSSLFYILGVVGFLLLILWIGDLHPLISFERAATLSVPSAIANNISLIVIFGLQHCVMAQRKNKPWSTRLLPEPLEQSANVMVLGLICVLVTFSWEAVEGVLWNVPATHLAHELLRSLYFLGVVVLFLSMLFIIQFQYFNRQNDNPYKGKRWQDYKGQKKTFYSIISRSPCFGFVLLVWATPFMSYTHLLLAVCFTLYILFGAFNEQTYQNEIGGKTVDELGSNVPKVFPFIGL